MTDKMKLIGCALVLFAGGMFLMSMLFGPKYESLEEINARANAAKAARAAPTATTEPARAEPKRPSCVIGKPGTEDEVPLLPTQEGFDEFHKAVASTESGEALLVVFRANGGFHVEKGTPCVAVETGFLISRVRVVAGRHAGKTGWLPNEWRQGE